MSTGEGGRNTIGKKKEGRQGRNYLQKGLLQERGWKRVILYDEAEVLCLSFIGVYEIFSVYKSMM